MDTQSDTGSGSPADAGGVIVRDDQFDFYPLLNSVKACRKSGNRLKFIDSGRLASIELEELAKAGADLYTSDLARQDYREFILANNAAKRGGAVIAYFHQGPFVLEEKEKTISFTSLKEMGRSGICLYVSNGRLKREFPALEELAYACAKSGGRFVVYHHGPLDPALEDLARQGAWVHMSGRSLEREDDAVLLCDSVRTARAHDANIVLHIESPLNLAWLEDIFEAGAFVLFQTPPSDYRSPQRPFELRAKRRKLDFRTSYLFPAFML